MGSTCLIISHEFEELGESKLRLKEQLTGRTDEKDLESSDPQL